MHHHFLKAPAGKDCFDMEKRHPPYKDAPKREVKGTQNAEYKIRLLDHDSLESLSGGNELTIIKTYVITSINL